MFPPRVDNCLPEDYLARFVVEQLDLGGLDAMYSGRGSISF